MKIPESSNLSKLFATRLNSPDQPQDKQSRIEAGLAAGVENTLDAAKSLTTVSQNADETADVASANKEASSSKPEDLDRLANSLNERIQANPSQAFAAQANNLDLQKITDLLR